MTVAISGAVITDQRPSSGTTMITYHRQCGSCRYTEPSTYTINVSNVGTMNAGSMNCPRCGSSTPVQFQ